MYVQRNSADGTVMGLVATGNVTVVDLAILLLQDVEWEKGR